MKLGFIGLGRMGKNMVLHLLEQGIEVVAWNRSQQPLEEVSKAGAVAAKSLEDLVSKLESPRIIWLMLTAGSVIDQFIDQLAKLLKVGDLIIDGGNSFYKDSLRRADKLAQNGIHFMDVGTSGGIEGARHGACLMVGGSKEDFQRVEEILKAAAKVGAYGYLGEIGAGHFAKMVHNAIEYGMMESIAEGATLLKNGPFQYNLQEVFRVYGNGSIIESRLINWILAELKEDPTLSTISSTIGSAGTAGKAVGEGHWTVQAAKELKIEVPVIKVAIKVREQSGKDQEDSPSGFRNKIVSAMRGQFGGHPVKKSAA